MGFLKDMRTLTRQADTLRPPEHRGFGGGLRALRDTAAQGTRALTDAQRHAELAQHLAVHGLPGRAIITGIRDTGISIDRNPCVELDLDVTLGDRAPYAVSHRQVISRIAVAGFQPGATVPVRVDPADERTLIVG
jgi:hypothetical protein